MPKIVRADAIGDWRIDIVFDDGTRGIVDLSNDLGGAMFEPLRDPEYFSRLELDEYGVITWPNGADLAPDAIFADFAKSKNGPTMRQPVHGS